VNAGISNKIIELPGVLKKYQARCQWLITVILATQEAEIRRIEV
jgi:hypothetical protein